MIRSILDTATPGPVVNLQAMFTPAGLAITWQPPSNYMSVFVAGYEIVVRDTSDSANVFDTIKLVGWKSLAHTVKTGIGMLQCDQND